MYSLARNFIRPTARVVKRSASTKNKTQTKVGLRNYTVKANVDKIIVDPSKKPGIVPYLFSKQYEEWLESQKELYGRYLEFNKDRKAYTGRVLAGEEFPARGVVDEEDLESIFGPDEWDQRFVNFMRFMSIVEELIENQPNFIVNLHQSGPEVDDIAWEMYATWRSKTKVPQWVEDREKSWGEYIAGKEHVLKSALGQRWVLVKYQDLPINEQTMSMMDPADKVPLMNRFKNGFFKGLTADQRNKIWAQIQNQAKDVPESAKKFGELTQDQFFNRPQTLIDQAKSDLAAYVTAKVAPNLGTKDEIWAMYAHQLPFEPKPAQMEGAKMAPLQLGELFPSFPPGLKEMFPRDWAAPAIYWFKAMAFALNELKAGDIELPDEKGFRTALNEAMAAYNNPDWEEPLTPEEYREELEDIMEEKREELDDFYEEWVRMWQHL